MLSSEFIIFPEERLHLVQRFLSVASVASSCLNFFHVEDIKNSSGNKKLLQKENCFAFFERHLEPTLVSKARVKLFSLNGFLNLTLFTSRCTPTITHTKLFIHTRIKHNLSLTSLSTLVLYMYETVKQKEGQNMRNKAG